MPMKTVLRMLAVAGLTVILLPGATLWHGDRDAATVEEACEVLDTLAALPLKCIPPALLREAQGLVIIPGVVKAGLVVGGRHGHGVVLRRLPEGGWSRPEFISLSGASVGLQAGIQSTDLVLVFKTRAGLDRLGKGKLTLGADAAVAAGPVGRQAEADTDARLKAEIFSYSRSRGLFAGVSLEGAILRPEHAETEAYYRREVGHVLDPRTGQLVPVTTPSAKLQLKLTQLTSGPVPPVVLEPPMGPPPIPPGTKPPPPSLQPPPLPPAPPPVGGKGPQG
jgi:lipid-binding SYLF domain-containing protein